MSKLRFTDAEKWRDPWYQSLSLIHKALWQYLTDNCDNAGVWVVNQREAEFHIGQPIDWPAALMVFSGRVECLGSTKWHLLKFTAFQYPGGLSHKSAPHRQVMRLLSIHGLSGAHVAGPEEGEKEATYRLLCSLKDKDKEKDKDQDRDQDKESNADEAARIASHEGVCQSAGVNSATPLPVGSDADAWRFGVASEPWARSLTRACKIGPKNWTKWKELVDKHGLPVVESAARSIPAADCWPEAVSDCLAKSRGQANPADVIAPRIRRLTL